MNLILQPPKIPQNQNRLILSDPNDLANLLHFQIDPPLYLIYTMHSDHFLTINVLTIGVQSIS